MGRVTPGVCQESRINIVSNGLIRLLAFGALDAARSGAADHFQQVGIYGCCLGLKLWGRLESTFVLKQQVDADSDTAISTENTFKNIRVVEIRLDSDVSMPYIYTRLDLVNSPPEEE